MARIIDTPVSTLRPVVGEELPMNRHLTPHRHRGDRGDRCSARRSSAACRRGSSPARDLQPPDGGDGPLPLARPGKHAPATASRRPRHRSTSASRRSTGPGSMGFHFINGGLLDASTSIRRSPRLSSTSPTSTASSTWSRSSSSPSRPTGMPPIRASCRRRCSGRMFMVNRRPNRYDIPAFYSLHVWLWKPNPARPVRAVQPANVSCDGAVAAGGSSTAALAAAAQLAAARGVKFDCEVRRQVA